MDFGDETVFEALINHQNSKTAVPTKCFVSLSNEEMDKILAKILHENQKNSEMVSGNIKREWRPWNIESKHKRFVQQTVNMKHNPEALLET